MRCGASVPHTLNSEHKDHKVWSSIRSECLKEGNRFWFTTRADCDFGIYRERPGAGCCSTRQVYQGHFIDSADDTKILSISVT